jgi:hypothetical protein
VSLAKFENVIDLGPLVMGGGLFLAVAVPLLVVFPLFGRKDKDSN